MTKIFDKNGSGLIKEPEIAWGFLLFNKSLIPHTPTTHMVVGNSLGDHSAFFHFSTVLAIAVTSQDLLKFMDIADSGSQI